MRVAIVSDIHGSLRALEAVVDDLDQSSPDVVLHGGDLVVNGPRPNEVINTLRELGWEGVLGNTDEMLWKLDDLPLQLGRMPRFEPLLKAIYEHTAPAALTRLSDENLRWLRGLPARIEFQDITLLHARPGDLWRAPSPDAEDDEMLSAYEQLGTTIIVYGHIHRPFVRQVSAHTIANSGSVGLTWDGDPRASYLLVEDGKTEIHRIAYDIEKEVSDLRKQEIPYCDWLSDMRRLGRFVRPDTYKP